jgi:hypothetical protein
MRFDHRNPVRVLVQKSEIKVNVDQRHVLPAEGRHSRRDALIAQRTVLPREDYDLHDCTLLHSAEPTGLENDKLVVVRPVTSIAVAVLLGIILLAFVFKLATGGLTP